MRATLKSTVAMVLFLSLTTLSCAASRYIGYASSPDAPAPSGQLQVPGLLGAVQVTYDSHHVPHIVAQNEHDLWFAIGYVQARDRLFQMDMLRRMASGRISELLGAQAAPTGYPFSDTVGMDRFFRVMGLGQEATQTAGRLPPESMAVLNPYVDGINTYIKSGAILPIEYRLLDEAPAVWTAADVLTVARLTTFQLSVNMAHELLRYILAVQVGPEAQQEIYPGTPPVGPNIIERGDVDFRSMPRGQGTTAPSGQAWMRNSDIDPAAWLPTAVAFLDTLGRIQHEGRPYLSPAASNSWAVAGTHAAGGKPILANDPHLVHGAPATFMLMHMTAPGIDAIGAVLPGTPFLTLGRNRHVGWAATNTFADVQDVYLEKLDPNDSGSYQTPDGPAKFQIEKHVIRIRDGRDKYRELSFDLRYTRHGAVLNDAMIEGMPDAQPMALKTSSVWQADETMALVRVLRAGNVKEYFDALGTWGLPIQNWVAIDDAGHIGYFPMGLVPMRTTFNGTFPVPGWTGEYEWQGHIPFDQLPKMYDPPSGVIVTANNQVMPAEDYPWSYSIDTMQGYRADRIRKVLTSKNDWTADGFRELHTDSYAPQADRLLPALFAALDGASLDERERRALDALKSWNRFTDTGSVGASIFYATYRESWQIAMDDDVPDLFSRMVKVFSYTYGFFDRLWAEAPGARVWDVKGTSQIEDRDEVLRLGFKRAVKNLSKKLGSDINRWTWGRLHTITFHHPFGKSVPGAAFDIGPAPIPGSWDTVWAAGFGFWDPNYMFDVSEGPAFRHVLDFSKPDDCSMVVDLGQSGWPMTPQYSNAVEDWKGGRLWRLSMDPAVYADGAEGTLNLVP